MTVAAAGSVVTVAPARSMRETICVAASALLILTSMMLLTRVNAQQGEEYKLMDWQISAFEDLDPTDQAIYNALHAAAQTLWFGYEFDKHWSTIAELDDPEFGLPPFGRDLSWRRNGEVQWQLTKSFSFDGATVYFGNRGRVPGQGAYLLILSHAHKGASYTDQSAVWRHSDPNAPAPDTIVRDSLIRNGWREIVPYSGETELRRLGRKIQER